MSAWDRHAIKAELNRRGLTLAGIARRAGLEVSACRAALRRRNPGGRSADAIAQALGVEPSVLWPERYGPGAIRPDHRSRRRRGRASPKRGRD